MAVFRKALGKLSRWRKARCSSAPAESIEYEFEVQVGLTTRINRVLEKSAAIENQTRQLFVPTAEALEHVGMVDVVEGHPSGVGGEPRLGHTQEVGERETSDTASRKVNDTAESVDAVPATDGILAGQGGATTASGILDNGSTTPCSSGQTDMQDRDHREDKNDTAKAPSHDITNPIVRMPTTESNIKPKPDLEVPSTFGDMRGTSTGSTESSSWGTNGESCNPTKFTTPSLFEAVVTPAENLALVPDKSFHWSNLLSGRDAGPDAERAPVVNLTAISGTTVIDQPPPICNCEEKHAAELEDLREELKEGYEIELELKMEKLQDKHDEKLKELKSELDQVASNRDYVKILGKRKLDEAIDAKNKLQQTLHGVEGIVKVKDAVIETAEAKAARLEAKNKGLEAKMEEKTQEHAATLEGMQVAVNTYFEERAAYVQDLEDQLSQATASRVDTHARGADEQKWIEYFAERPMDAALAYVNAKKQLASVEKSNLDLQNQLNNFNSESEQHPARLAGVTRLLEFKDGHILELQKVIAKYHDALEQSQANSLRDQEHVKADVKIREAELESLQKDKADLQTRLAETRQGWENVAQMFGRQVFDEDIASSMNELYEIVKQDNTFLCSTLEGQASQIVRLMREEKHLKIKVLDLEKAMEKAERTREQYKEEARAAKYAAATASIEMDICVDDLRDQIMSKDDTIATVNEKVETLRAIVDASVNPIRGSAALMRQKDAEIASLTHELEVANTRKLEVEQRSKDYDDLESWKNNLDSQSILQEFASHGLQEKVVQLEKRLRVALVASDPGNFEAAQSMVQQIDNMAQEWCSARTEYDRVKSQAGHDNQMLHNERVYFEASIGAAKKVLMEVWTRYGALWDGLQNKGIIPVEDPMGPREILDQVTQIFQDDDAQQAGFNAIAERCRIAATEGSMQQPQAEDMQHDNQLIDAAKAFLEQQNISTGGSAKPEEH
ncbi:MAG: hypothetical protein Q9182_005164 [Xanthomendoza sp. 2 TL-2023]